MFMFFEPLKEIGKVARQRVNVSGVINLKSRPISHYDVSLAYGDLVLIVAMLRDYVRTLDELKGEDIQYRAYYRNKFLRMAERISEQIEYDYDKAYEKCNKKKEKESDIGEEAMLLALKRGAKKEEK